MITLLALVPEAKGILRWERVYGEVGSERGFDVVQIEDGGYIVAGDKGVPNRLLLMRVDSLGETLWLRSYAHNTHPATGFSLVRIASGVLVAGSASNDSGDPRCYLLRADDFGDTLWTRLYGATFCYTKRLTRTRDGGLVAAGYLLEYPPLQSDGYLLRTDSLGDSLWACIYGGAQPDCAEDVVQTQDGGFAVFGNSSSYHPSNLQGWLVRFDSLGHILWLRTYGGRGGPDAFYAGVVTPDGSLVAAGTTTTYGTGGSIDAWLVKLNGNGDTIWTRSYGDSNNETIDDLTMTSDGGYLIAGITGPGVIGGDGLLIKVDSLGNEQWVRTYHRHSEGSRFYSVRQTSDGGYIAAGKSTDISPTGMDLWLVKTDAEGSVALESEPPVSSRRAASGLRLEAPTIAAIGAQADYFLTQPGPTALDLLDVCGRRVTKLVACRQEAGWHRTDLSTAAPCGVYMLRLSTSRESVTRKLIVQQASRGVIKGR